MDAAARSLGKGRAVNPHQSRFAFGENWASFLAGIEEPQIEEAEKALQSLLGRQRFDRLRFLDIGSGSGLSSLVARRLGAQVHSFDYDAQSVTCTTTLRDRYFPGDPDWTIERGSILDRAYLDRLGRYDIVYSWGVLHHTGSMKEALENASRLVAPHGTFAFALYRKTRLCWFWKLEKQWYCQASSRCQAATRTIYVTLLRLAFALTGRDFASYKSNYHGSRGMDFMHDVHDWLGGYPYESASPAGLARTMDQLGFSSVRSRTRPYSTGLFGSGCDEYVYACREWSLSD